MSNPSARHADEFRRETADYIISTGRPITQCRSELGLNSNTVRKWSRTAAASSWVTSRICAPARGGSTCPRSSTRTPTWWWAGRSPRDLTADIAVSAPASAKSRGYVAGNAIFHADRGAQHASRLLSEWARDNDVRLTCSRTAPAAATTTRWPSRSSPRLRILIMGIALSTRVIGENAHEPTRWPIKELPSIPATGLNSKRLASAPTKAGQ